jgi:hypothetical protein
MNSLFDTEKRTANALESIDKRLDEHFKPAKQPTPPQCAREFADVVKGFLSGARDAQAIRQDALKKAEPYEGSQAYSGIVADANSKYADNVSGLADSAKAAVKSAIALFREQYEKNTMRPVPDDVLKEVQMFSMLAHPSASQYQRYERVFRDFPQAQEILVSKYDADMEPTDDGKKGYVPKYGSGAIFAPYRPMSDVEVQSALDTLQKNAYSLIDGVDTDNIMANAQRAAVERAVTPAETLAGLNIDYTEKVERLLSAVDWTYRPSTKEENPENSTEEEYNRDKSYHDMIDKATVHQPDSQKVLNYYTKNG